MTNASPVFSGSVSSVEGVMQGLEDFWVVKRFSGRLCRSCYGVKRLEFVPAVVSCERLYGVVKLSTG